MAFDPASAVPYQPDSSAPSDGASKFDPSSAHPVVDSPKELDSAYRYQYENKRAALEDQGAKLQDVNRKLDIVAKYFSHPMATYEHSVEQSFDRPAVLGEIPHIDTPADAGTVRQAVTPIANAATGTVNALQSAGGASLMLNPVALAYATPYFAAKTWDASKKAFSDFANAIQGNVDADGKPVSTGQLSGDVVDTAMNVLGTIAGATHGVKGAIKDLGPRAPEPVKGAFDIASSTPVESIPNVPKFDPASARPVSEVTPEVKPTEATPAPEAPAAEPVAANTNAPVEDPVANRKRYEQIETRLVELAKTGEQATPAGAKEAADLLAETEALKGGNSSDPGMPPEALDQNGQPLPPASIEASTPPSDLTAQDGPTVQDVTQVQEPAPPAPEPSSFGSSESNTYGVAARVTDARANAGDVTPVEPGVGTSAEGLTQRGRDLLKSGADPEEVFANFDKTKRLSSDDIALVRAQGEILAKAANDAAEKYGPNSPEYQSAAKADSDWVKRVKPLQTESSEAFRAQQGETEIDTGTFHGIRRAFNDSSGRDFTPREAAKAKEISSVVKAASDSADAATQKVFDTIDRQTSPARKTAGARLLDTLKERHDAALVRLRAKAGRISSGIDPTDLKDIAEVGAYHIAKGVTEFSKWSAEMAKTLGKEISDKIQPYLHDIFDAAKKTRSDTENAQLGDSVAGIWKRAKDYIDSGETDFDNIRHKIASDLGISADEVSRKLAEPKSVKNITDDMYRKLAAKREVIANAKSWVKQQSTPAAIRALKGVFNAGFRIATFGHGTVAPFTHAPLLQFNPSTFKIFWGDYFKGFKLMGIHDGGAYHERVMADLVRDPNYIRAKRAGLANDPHKASSDYEKAWLGGYFHKIGLIGNRGFDSLKLIRQDLFNQLWEKTPESQRNKASSELIADEVNHATGYVKKDFGPIGRSTFFAPRLIASQFAYLVGDTAKAADTIMKGAKATPEQRTAAIRHVKTLATIAAGYFAMLAVNDGLLMATGSKQRVNFTDPHDSDWLKPKVGGLTIAPASGPLAAMRLLANLLRIEAGQLEGKEKRGGKTDALIDLGTKFARSKLSPTMGVAADLATGKDYSGRPLPFSNEKVPAYMRREGIGKYSYSEYLTTHVTPIPVSEAAREVWKKQGMDDSLIEHWLKAITMGVEAGAVGARVTPDYKVEGKK